MGAAGAGVAGPGGSGAGASTVGEDGLHSEGIPHGGDDAQPATTAGQARTVRANTRRIHAAQVQARVGTAARGAGLAGRG